ncbi:MAG TPA: hypothetical protein VJB96_02250 [Patescibacteria group bacterium]|nr:hypothetical protein [Patescibacteria group bacterium]
MGLESTTPRNRKNPYLKDNIGAPFADGEGIVEGSELDKPHLRELAHGGNGVRLPLQNGKTDDVLPAWIEG